MSTVVLRVETELDPTAAPRVFGYLGGLGHIPVQAVLRREGTDMLVIEVQFASAVDTAQKISAKVEQMPFVLTSGLAHDSAPDSGPQSPEKWTPCTPRVDAAAMRFAAAQRVHAIRHRAHVNLNS